MFIDLNLQLCASCWALELRQACPVYMLVDKHVLLVAQWQVVGRMLSFWSIIFRQNSCAWRYSMNLWSNVHKKRLVNHGKKMVHDKVQRSLWAMCVNMRLVREAVASSAVFKCQKIGRWLWVGVKWPKVVCVTQRTCPLPPLRNVTLPLID